MLLVFVSVIQTTKLFMSYRNKVCFLLKRYRSTEFYGFLFICNTEFKIYKIYIPKSVHAAIYLKKMNPIRNHSLR